MQKRTLVFREMARDAQASANGFSNLLRSRSSRNTRKHVCMSRNDSVNNPGSSLPTNAVATSSRASSLFARSGSQPQTFV